MNDATPQKTADKTPGTDVATRDPVSALLDTNRKAFQMALPKHVDLDHFLRISLTTIKRTPKLLEADRRSLIASLMTAAQLGLEPDGVLGHAYLVPFKVKNRQTQKWETQVQFIPGYKGYLALARNSGEVLSIQAKVVREGDKFDYSFGFNETLEHKPSGDSSKPLTHVWLVVNLKNGGRIWDVMDKNAIDRIMRMSQGYQNAEKSYEDRDPRRDSPWHIHYDVMALKTIIRANAKFFPLQVQKMAALDDAVDLGGIGALHEGHVVIEGVAEDVGDAEPPIDEEKAEGEQKPIEEKKAEPEKKEAAVEKVEVKTEPKPEPKAEPKAEEKQAETKPEEKAAKPSRPARKEAAVEEEKPKDPLAVRKDDTGESYYKRARAQFSSAKSEKDTESVADQTDWDWLKKADAKIYEKLSDFYYERQDYFRDAEPTEH